MPAVFHLNMLMPALAGHKVANPRVLCQCLALMIVGREESESNDILMFVSQKMPKNAVTPESQILLITIKL